MRREWSRLVASVCLASFLVANTGLGAAVVSHLPAVLHPASDDAKPASCDTDRESAEAEAPRCGRQGCGCCVQKHGRDEAPRDRGPCCPGCPKGPFAPKPADSGGCALCNVAKVPCLAPAARPTRPDCCLGGGLPNPLPLYTSPAPGRLIRPPRA